MQYKLKQDTLENKAGEIFTRRDVNGVDSFVPPSGDADRAIAVTDDRLALFDEINIAPNRLFVPKIGSTYYFIEATGSIATVDNGQRVDDADRAALGNAYKTKAEANIALAFLKARAALRSHPLNQYQPTTTDDDSKCVFVVAKDTTNGSLVPYSVLSQFAPQAIAYYETEAEVSKAITDQKSNYQAYFAGL